MRTVLAAAALMVPVWSGSAAACTQIGDRLAGRLPLAQHRRTAPATVQPLSAGRSHAARPP